jgi:hypothetical protein
MITMLAVALLCVDGVYGMFLRTIENAVQNAMLQKRRAIERLAEQENLRPIAEQKAAEKKLPLNMERLDDDWTGYYATIKSKKDILNAGNEYDHLETFD